MPRHLQVLFHVAAVAPAFLRDTKHQLTQLLPSVGTGADVDVAVAGFVLAKPECRRMALDAAREAGLYEQLPSEVAVQALRGAAALAPLWVAVHDADRENAAAAAALWAAAGAPPTASRTFLDALLPYSEAAAAEVRAAAARAVSDAAGTDGDLVSHACDHARRAAPGASAARSCGAAAVLSEVAAALPSASAVAGIMQHVLETGLTDRNDSVRSAFLDAGTAVVAAHGASQLRHLMPLIEQYLENRNSLEESLYDLVRGPLAPHATLR
jgi:hypothetical protein